MANHVELLNPAVAPPASARSASFVRAWPPIVGKPKSPWLWSNAADLFWVAGGGSLLFLALLVPVSFAFPDLAVYALATFAFLTWLCNTPHYAATYALIYREREAQPYAWRTLRASLPFFFAALAFCTVFLRESAPFVARVYLTWSPYHYGAQNFGLAAMYAARNGAPFNPDERKRVQLSFGAISLFSMVLANTDVSQYARRMTDPSLFPQSGLLARAAFAKLPSAVYYVALLFVVAAAIQFTLIAVRRARAGKPLPTAAILLFCTHLTWFVVPRLRLHADDHEWIGPTLGIAIPAAIPFFHCAQYLGVSGWRARITSAVRPLPVYALLVTAGWILFQGTIDVLEGAFDRNVVLAGIVVVGLVNIHHFYIDGLMWKRGRMPEPARLTEAAPSEAGPVEIANVVALDRLVERVA